MLLSTVLLVIWLVVFIFSGNMLFEWWWLIASYIVETLCWIGIGIVFWQWFK